MFLEAYICMSAGTLNECVLAIGKIYNRVGFAYEHFDFGGDTDGDVIKSHRTNEI